MQHFITSFGYAAIVLLMIAESACIPVPSEVTMLLGGAMAGGAIAGTQLNLAWVIVAGTAGNVVGSYLAWAVGRYAGRAAVLRWGRRLRIRPAHLARAEDWFARHGPVAVFAARLLPVVRTFISLPAGVGRMPGVRFGIYTVLGCLPWTAALAATGYVVGGRWRSIANGFHGPTYLIAAVVVVAILAAVALAWRRRPPAREAAPGIEEAGSGIE